MKKKLIVCIIALGMLTGCGSIPQLSNGEEALVEFKDGTMFSVDEVWNEVKDQYALSVVLDKIDKKILESEYKDQLDDVDTYIKNYETYLKSNYLDEDGNLDEEALNNALNQAGYSSIDVLLEQQRISYLQDLATTDYAKSKITDKEIKNYYKNEAVGDIHCVHILVAPEGTDTASDTKAKEKAQDIISAIKKDIKSGTKTADAFKKYENDTSVTYQDLDYFNKGDMVTEFEDAAFKLKKGSYTTSPVKTSYGYHVILKIDEKEKDTLENLSDKIKETLAEELKNEDTTTAVNAMIELRKEYGVEWHDSDLEDNYNRYMNNLINQ